MYAQRNAYMNVQSEEKDYRNEKAAGMTFLFQIYIRF